MAYHPVTIGTLVDEIVQRATGSSIAQHLRTMVTDPDVESERPGLPETLVDRVVTAPRTDGAETLIESGTAGPDIRFGLGYQLASPSMPGLGPASYGHTGAGGRLGIADHDHGVGVGFGYLCSRMRDIGPGGDPRWKRLLDALATCLER